VPLPYGAGQGHPRLQTVAAAGQPNDPKVGAKELFGRKVLPAAMPTRVLGFYAHGCIAGAEALADQRRHLAGDAAVAQIGSLRIPTWSRC